MTKADLRAHYRLQRRLLPEADWQTRCVAIRENLFRYWSPCAEIVHTFLPIVWQREVDTWPITHRLWQEFSGVRVAVSVTDPLTHTLTHYPLTPDIPLRENAWGIPEPIPDPLTKLQPTAFDLVLVPLLIFDRRGHRLGYGGGYYDRFLAQCRPDCQRTGLSLFEPIDRIMDVWTGDVPLTAGVTPERMWRF